MGDDAGVQFWVGWSGMASGRWVEGGEFQAGVSGCVVAGSTNKPVCLLRKEGGSSSSMGNRPQMDLAKLEEWGPLAHTWGHHRTRHDPSPGGRGHGKDLTCLPTWLQCLPRQLLASSASWGLEPSVAEVTVIGWWLRYMLGSASSGWQGLVLGRAGDLLKTLTLVIPLPGHRVPVLVSQLENETLPCLKENPLPRKGEGRAGVPALPLSAQGPGVASDSPGLLFPHW